MGIGYAIFVVVFALAVHPIEDNSGVNPELDNYVARAADVGHGVVPTDRFRPLFYVFCAGIVGRSLSSNYFLGCQVVSLLSGLLFVYCSVRIAKLLLGTAAAWVLFPLVAFNVNVLQASVRAASDMLFQALIMLLLLSCVKIDLVPRKRRLHFALMGVLFGLAYSTRYTAMFVLPAVVLFYVVRHKNYSVSHFVAFGLGAVVAAAPQLLVNWAQAGSPFANDNWKNIALRYLGRTDMTKDYFVSIIIESPRRFLDVATNDLTTFIQESLPRMFFGEQWGEVVPARLAGPLLLAIPMSVVVVVAKSSRRRRRYGLWLLIPALVSMLLGVNLAFFMWPRYALPVVPLLCMYLTGALLRMIPRGSWQRAAVAAFVLFSMIGQYSDIRVFAANHVRDDLRAGEWLVSSVGSAPVVLGTSLFLGNHLTCPYGYLDSLSVIKNRASYVSKVYSTIREMSPGYVIANPRSSYGNETPPYLLNAPNDTFPFLVPVKRIGTSVVFKVDHQKFLEAAAALARSSRNPPNGRSDPAVPGDFNGDGAPDLLWRNVSTGQTVVWLVRNATFLAQESLPPLDDVRWQAVAFADFTGDGRPDVVWRNAVTGQNMIWQLDEVALVSEIPLPPESNLNWQIVAAADMNGDGAPDLLWRNRNTGQDVVWLMSGTTFSSQVQLPPVADRNWQIMAAGDLDGDGRADLVWRNGATGQNVVWFMNGTTFVSQAVLPTVADPNWQIAWAADFNADGKADLVWRNSTTGQTVVWYLDGGTFLGQALLPPVADPNWMILRDRR